jgi:hypothetical protein
MYFYYIIKWVYIFNLNVSIQNTNFLYTLFLQTNDFYVITHNVSKLYNLQHDIVVIFQNINHESSFKQNQTYSKYAQISLYKFK